MQYILNKEVKYTTEQTKKLNNYLRKTLEVFLFYVILQSH